ncbi:hypothetical protein ACLOJK_029328 [Asimina triloba]
MHRRSTRIRCSTISTNDGSHGCHPVIFHGDGHRPIEPHQNDDNDKATADPSNPHANEHDSSMRNGDILALTGQRCFPLLRSTAIGDPDGSIVTDLGTSDGSDAPNDIFIDLHPTVDLPTSSRTAIDSGYRQRGWQQGGKTAAPSSPSSPATDERGLTVAACDAGGDSTTRTWGCLQAVGMTERWARSPSSLQTRRRDPVLGERVSRGQRVRAPAD